ncbi:MAG: hypothetical protein ACREHD_28390, partial [Pirellulales bacterium]
GPKTEPPDAGITVSALLSQAGVAVSFPAAGAVPGIAVYTADTKNGVWQYEQPAGAWTTFSTTIADTSARLLQGSDLVRFVPSHEWSGTAQIGFYLWDGTTDAATGTSDTDASTVDLTARGKGGSWPFSVASATATVTVNPANDAPQLINLPATPPIQLTAIAENLSSAADTGFQIKDTAMGLGNYIKVNAADGTLGIAVTGIGATDDTNGQWQWSADDVNWTPLSTTTVGVTAPNLSNALLLDGGDWVRFLPNPEFNDLMGPAPTITFAAWDQTFSSLNGGNRDLPSTPTTPSLVNLSLATSDPNGTLPFSETLAPSFSIQTATAAMAVTPAHDAPSLQPLPNPLDTITEDVSAVDDTGFQISDPVHGLANYVQINAVGGKLGIAVTGMGAADQANGVWQWSADDTNWNTIPANTSLDAALLLDGSDWLRFLPNSEFSSATGPSPTLSFAGWDETGSALNAGGAADLPSTPTKLTIVDLQDIPTNADPGGTLPFSESSPGTLPVQTETLTLYVAPGMDAPRLTSTAITLAAMHEDAGSGFAGEPADPGFQISDPANGLASYIKISAADGKLG